MVRKITKCQNIQHVAFFFAVMFVMVPEKKESLLMYM